MAMRADGADAKPSAAECVARIRAAGGVAVLAHPVTLHPRAPSQRAAVVARLAAAGLAGLEVLHPRCAVEEIDELRALARRCDLVATAGSDYHGRRKPERWLGQFARAAEAGPRTLELLAARRPR
jgi:predicted metal-dependent phosphoesterase TrpH